MATNTKYNVTGQGRLWIAPRNSTGVSGAFTEVGDADNLQVAFNQTFVDVQESQTGNRSTVVHALTSTDGSITLDVLNVDGSNLARALYGTTAVGAAATVTGEAHSVFVGDSIWVVPGATSVVVKKGATTLVLNTDYTYEASNGRITFLEASIVITGATANAITVDYTHTGYAAKVEALTAGLKDYKFVFEQVNYDGSISRHEIHRVALDMAKTFSLITTGVNKLQLTGKALPATEVTTAGLSKYYSVLQK